MTRSKAQVASPKSQVASRKSRVPSPKSQVASRESRVPSRKSRVPSRVPRVGFLRLLRRRVSRLCDSLRGCAPSRSLLPPQGGVPPVGRGGGSGRACDNGLTPSASPTARHLPPEGEATTRRYCRVAAQRDCSRLGEYRRRRRGGLPEFPSYQFQVPEFPVDWGSEAGGRFQFSVPRSQFSSSAIAGPARLVLWLNPERQRYWNTGDSVMAAYADMCDEVEEVRTLAQLERFVERVALPTGAGRRVGRSTSLDQPIGSGSRWRG